MKTKAFEDLIQSAQTLINDGNYQAAIPLYSEALVLADQDEEKIDIYNVLGRLYINSNALEKATDSFQASLKIHQQLPEEKKHFLAGNKAAILNNLGMIQVGIEPEKAEKLHEEAVGIFTNLHQEKPTEFKAHLANSYFSWADALYKGEKLFFAKKHFKNALVLYKELAEEQAMTFNPLIANVHYYLGNIYNDDNSVYDAQMHFKNSLKLYRELHQIDESQFKPFLAAVLNNLAVVTKSMTHFDESATHYQEALNLYAELHEAHPEGFAPYLAAAHNSLGILYSEMDKREEALDHYKQTIEIYNQLADKEPETYTHYLATALHNAAIIYDELEATDKALDFYNQALAIRKDLAKMHPDSFDPDVCVTAMNIITLYQSLGERTVDISLKAKAQEMLSDIKKRIMRFSDEHPTIESLKSDLDYYLVYYKELTLEYLEVLHAMGTLDDKTKEIDSLVVAAEKLGKQQDIIDLMDALLKKYPANGRLLDEKYAAEVKLAWFLIRAGQIDNAQLIIDRLMQDHDDPALEINHAHIKLLSDQKAEAIDIYRKVKDIKSADNQPWMNSIKKDFDALVRDDFDSLIIKAVLAELK